MSSPEDPLEIVPVPEHLDCARRAKIMRASLGHYQESRQLGDEPAPVLVAYSMALLDDIAESLLVIGRAASAESCAATLSELAEYLNRVAVALQRRDPKAQSDVPE